MTAHKIHSHKEPWSSPVKCIEMACLSGPSGRANDNRSHGSPCRPLCALRPSMKSTPSIRLATWIEGNPSFQSTDCKPNKSESLFPWKETRFFRGDKSLAHRSHPKQSFQETCHARLSPRVAALVSTALKLSGIMVKAGRISVARCRHQRVS